MTIDKSPLQLHYENIQSLQSSVIRWNLNNHYIIAENIKNINRVFTNEKFSDFELRCATGHLEELNQNNKNGDYALFKQLYSDQKYLNVNMPLTDNEKLSFVQRVSEYCRSIDRVRFYHLILEELNPYLELLLATSPSVTTQHIYDKYQERMDAGLLGCHFETLKEKLHQSEFQIFFDKLTHVPLFDRNDFSYLQENQKNLYY